MGLFRATPSLQPEISADTHGKLLIEAVGLGVKYVVGRRREDLQSLTYNTLLRRQTQKKEIRWALTDVDLVGYAGDILGIIGGNGAGKTTLCRVLSGLLRPDTGTLHIAGKVSALLSLGTGFNVELSGRDNILLNGMMLGLSRSDLAARLPDIIEFSGLGRFIDEPLKHYSSGMRARLGFSIAVTVEPEMLIIDEALSVGDLEFSEKAGRRMQELVAKSKIVVVVTHQLQFVEKYCTSVLWLAHGKVRAAGLPSDVVRAYAESATQGGGGKRAIIFAKTKPVHGSSSVIEAKQLGVQFSLRAGKAASHNRTRSLLPRAWLQKRAPFWALQDVTFRINEGDIVGVIGPNGAGKTTLCRVLSGILKADTGEVIVKGDITALLTLGTGFHEQLTGRDNVYLNGMMLGIPRKRLQALYPDIVTFSELAKVMDEPVKHYSRGMRVRLGFSIAAMINPDVLILDEALNVGDISFYEKASTKIQELITAAKAVIVVTHNLGFVEQVCTRALWLNAGMIQFDGDPKKAVAAYRQALTHRT